jgi:hypothetical protein
MMAVMLLLLVLFCDAVKLLKHGVSVPAADW